MYKSKTTIVIKVNKLQKITFRFARRKRGEITFLLAANVAKLFLLAANVAFLSKQQFLLAVNVAKS